MTTKTKLTQMSSKDRACVCRSSLARYAWFVRQSDAQSEEGERKRVFFYKVVASALELPFACAMLLDGRGGPIEMMLLFFVLLL